MTEPRWLEARELAMWRAFFDMRRHLERAMEAQLSEHGLSHPDYTVLVVLSELPGGVMRVRDLGERISWESSRLAHHLRRMEQRGLVVRAECADDRRGTMATITAAGMRAIQLAAPGHVEAVRRFMVDLLTPEEIDTMTSISLRVSQAVIDADP
jgi:DNA-binding MarR family transcriptional regulator